MRKKSILERALFHLGYVFVLWLVAGFIAFEYLTEPLKVYLFTTGSTTMIFGSGLLLFLDPVEKERLGNKQRLNNQILMIISMSFDCEIEEILGANRRRSLVDARGVFAYILRKHCDDTFKEIGLILNKDHSTVMNLRERTENLLDQNDRPICLAVATIEEQLFKQL